MNLVDTDVLIDIQRGHPPALAWFAGLKELPAVAGLVVMELVQDARNAGEVRKALQLVAPLQVIWPSAADCAKRFRTSRLTIYPIAWDCWTP